LAERPPRIDHPHTYLAMANLANTFCKLGEIGEVKELQIQVLDWHKAHFGPRHQHTILAMKKLTYTLTELGEVTKAEELFAQVDE
jgi:hypothetical protein